jgi:hypothetical protein
MKSDLSSQLENNHRLDEEKNIESQIDLALRKSNDPDAAIRISEERNTTQT